jgi:hypothetical protein
MRNRAAEEPIQRPLTKGQVWRTRAAEIQILGLANQFVHYTVTACIGPRRTTAQVSGIEPMANYLKLTRARLLNPVARLRSKGFEYESASRPVTSRSPRGVLMPA